MSVIPLDGIAYGTQGLEALIAVRLGDARVHAAFVREGAALRVAELAASLRDVYRACQGASRRVPGRYRSRPPAPEGSAARSMAGRLSLSSRPPRELPEPLLTLEEGGCTVVARRVRAYLVVCLFDATLPLGMIRLLSGRLIATLSPELPLDDDDELDAGGPAAGERGSSQPAAPGASAAAGSRARRLLALLEGLTPEPHVARLRVSLRAGIALPALDQPEALASDAVPRIETAVEEILGLDRAALRRLL